MNKEVRVGRYRSIILSPLSLFFFHIFVQHDQCWSSCGTSFLKSTGNPRRTRGLRYVRRLAFHHFFFHFISPTKIFLFVTPTFDYL